jgi:two-component system, OmpR family, response regulator TctD
MRILLAEDTADLAEAVVTQLTRAGHAVTLASDGEHASTVLRADRFDLVILDLTLPHKGGATILREMRARRDRTPVLVTTALSAIDDRISLLDLGADDYLVKPFDLRELEARIRALLRRPMGMGASAEVFGNMTFDAGTRQVLVERTPVDLGRREFRLLEILLGQLGKPVRKERLIDQLFGPDDDVAPNAIELYVSRLRKKLGDASLDIATLRGEGYVARLRAGAEP